MSASPDPEPSPTPVSPPSDEVWVNCLSDNCLDDVTLPPGGVPTPPPSSAAADQMVAIPRPDYQSHEGRDLRIDLLRGYFVFAMIVDHVRGASPLYLITGGNRFYTSAAEGFILTSGLVAGLVYRRLIKRDGMAPALLKVLNRAITLYLLTVGITLVFSLFSEIAYLPWAQGVSFSDPIGFVVSVFTLHQTYYLIDVLLLYTVLFLVSPLAFILLDRGKGWWMMGGSALLYLLYQFYPQYTNLPWPIEGNYLFAFSAWQILFFAGLTLGYHQNRIPTLDRRGTRLALVITGVCLLLLIGVFYLVDTPTSQMPSEIAASSPVGFDIRIWLQDYLFSKADVRPGRLVASAVTFSFLFFFATYFWKIIKRPLSWLLIPLGQHSLNAYAFHIGVVGLIALALKPFNIPSPGPQGLNAAIQIASVLLIWYLVTRRFLTPSPKTRIWWNLSPVAIGLVIILALGRFPIPDHPGLVQAAPIASSTDRIPRRYGTAIPRTSQVQVAPQPTLQPGAIAAAQPNAEPTPQALTRTLPGSDELTSPYVGAIEGSLHERWFYSPELDRDMPYYIYLPPNYASEARRYPVLYMLHGLGGHREEWLAYNLIDAVDGEIRTNSIPPMIVVLPQGDKDYWIDHTNDGPRWGEYLYRDLVAHIDTTYRTLRSPASRAIGGLSMGGWGALYHAFTHPDVFGVVGAHSPGLRPDDGSVPFLGTGAEFDSKDPLAIARKSQNLSQIQIWIDLGEDDTLWLPRATELHNILTSRNIPHIWQVLPGGHDYNYWRDHVIDYVRFYSTALSQR